MFKVKKDKIRVRKLPKLGKLCNSLAVAAINNVTTANTSENHFSRENSEYTIMKNKSEELKKCLLF